MTAATVTTIMNYIPSVNILIPSPLFSGESCASDILFFFRRRVIRYRIKKRRRRRKRVFPPPTKSPKIGLFPLLKSRLATTDMHFFVAVPLLLLRATMEEQTGFSDCCLAKEEGGIFSATLDCTNRPSKEQRLQLFNGVRFQKSIPSPISFCANRSVPPSCSSSDTKRIPASISKYLRERSEIKFPPFL